MPTHFSETPMYQDIDHAWRDVIIALLDRVEGHPELKGGINKLSSRAGDVVAEIHGYQFALNPDLGRTFLRNPVRDMDPAYCAAEVLWCVSGTDQTAPLLPYAPSYQEKYGEADGTAWGAYGARLKQQWQWLFDTLRKHPEGRQAVLQVWNEVDLMCGGYDPPCKKDIPCLTQLMFLRRKEKLHMSAVMRSQDAWLGLPCDVFAFTCLQRLVAAEINCTVGGYVHCIPGSLHLYARYLDKAKEAGMWNPPWTRYENHEWALDDTLASARTGFAYIEALRTGKTNDEDRGAASDYQPLGTMCADLTRACEQKIRPGYGSEPRWSRLRKTY